MTSSRNNTLTLADLQPRDTSFVEWFVIHDAFNDSEIIPHVTTIVRPDFFTDEGRRAFWEEIVSSFNAGTTNPGVTAYVKMSAPVKAEYESFRMKVAQDIKINGTSTTDEALSHALLLRESAARRRAYFAGLQILQLSVGEDTEGEIYAKASEAVQTIEDKSVKDEYTVGEVFSEISEAVQERRREVEAGKAPCIATGLRMLDNVIDGGFKSGNLVVIAARPGVGKTALAIQILRNSSADGHRGVFFSIEMTREEIGNRMLYSTGGVNSYHIWSGDMDWPAFEAAVRQMGALPILINDHARNLSEIVSRMTILARQGRCDVAFIDYLGLINPSDRRLPLYQQIADVTGTLKVTAKRLGIPIVLLCQLNREAAKEETDPDLFHLRDSGSIEQDADVVLMLKRSDENDLDVLVRKNRHGDSNVRITLDTNDTRTNYRDVRISKI